MEKTFRAIQEFNEIDNINEYVYNFDTSFERTIEKFIVKRKLRENNNNKSFSNELRMLKREKIIKHQKVLFENSTSVWNSYKFIRNEKNKFISDKIANTRNQKEMCYKIKELVLRTPKNMIKSVIFNNIEYNINSEIAENFNNYIVDSIRDIRCSIDDVQYKDQIPVINCRFKFRAISLLELRNICKTIKKKNYYRRISNNWITGI